MRFIWFCSLYFVLLHLHLPYAAMKSIELLTGTASPVIGSLSCRPLPPSDNKGKELAVIKQILH